jgi:CubicO group peptidase (beta-lactamase class C family)
MPSSLKFALKLVLGLALIAAGWTFIATQWGWKALPDAPAPTVEILDARFETAGLEAANQLETARLSLGAPGMTAAVAVDGELVWAAGAGWSNVETQTPATPDTLFRIGSTSKAMTSTVIARLVDRGALDPDDTVGEHFPDAPNEDWLPLTLAQLLSHTAGFPGYENNSDWPDAYETLRMKRQFDSVEDSLMLVDDARLLSAPGEGFYYTSFDIVLAAVMAERARGADYASLLERQVRAPLDLQTPILANSGPEPDMLARFYESRNQSQVRPRGAVNVSQRWPSGGLYSRSVDLVRVASAWLDDDYISEATREQFWTPMRLNSGEVNEQGYALGWRVNPESTSRFGEDAPVRIVHHGGVSRGAMSWLILYPELGIAVAVNINTEADEFSDFSSVEPEITRLFAEAAGRTPEGARRPD